MPNVYVVAGIAALVSFVLGVVFSAKVSRFFALIVSDVEKDYAKALEKIKALYDADTKALEAKVKEIQALYDADVAKLKSDLGDANNKVTVLTSVIATPAPSSPPPTTAAPTRTKAQIAADLADAQAKEAQLQADLAAATA